MGMGNTIIFIKMKDKDWLSIKKDYKIRKIPLP